MKYKIFFPLIITILLTACAHEDTNQYETYPDISVSAVHDYFIFLPTTEETTTIEETTTELDIWDMGLEWYGISYEDTNRTLRLITYEGYGYSRLSYYVACACWSRATEGYWGYSNLYRAFGENDEGYDLWMDTLGIADYAYVALDECYRSPQYIMYVNGVIEPYDYIYCEFDGSYMIYVWND